MLLVHPRFPRNILRMATDTVCCWRWILPSVQMPNAKTFLSSASIKIVPRHAGWPVPRKALIFIFRGCVQTFVPLSSCRDAGSLNSLFCIIFSCTGDPFSCLEVLQDEGMESAVAERCTVGLFGCCCCFLKLLKELYFKTCWRNRAKENIKANTTIEMLSSTNNLLRIIFFYFLQSMVCVHSSSLTNL